jgi:polyisoprenoid-binding protein YceI
MPTLPLLQDGAAVGAWDLDPATCVLEFRVKHFWGAIRVRGRFRAATGRIDVAAAGTVSGSIEAQSASLHSGNKQRDKHLRSPDFFDVENHPTVVFSVGEVHPLGDAGVRVTGDLTAGGRTQSITFDARLSDATQDHFTVDGEVSVDRRAEFGMNWSPLGIASPTALLVVHAEFAKSAHDKAPAD